MIRRTIKNFIGDILGYGRCPITKDTYWYNDIVGVPYSKFRGVLISKRALSDVPKEKIAEEVFFHGVNSPNRPVFGIEEILAKIPERCMHLPRRIF